MSEAVEVIISADDQASKKFAEVAVNAEKDLGKVKTAGEKLKGMAGVGGVLTRMLGGTELGGQIAQIGELTEKVNQFGSVAKMSGAGANIFRAGLASLVAVMSVQLGESIGKVIWGVNKTQEAMDAAAEASKRLQDQLLQMRDREFSSRMANISIIGNPEAQKAQLKSLFDELKNQDAAYEKDRASRLRQAEKLASTMDVSRSATARGAESNALIQEANQLAEQQNQLRDQQRAIIDLMADKARAIEQSFGTSLTQLNLETIALTQGENAAKRYELTLQGMSESQISWIMGVKQSNDEIKKANAENEKAVQLAQRVSESFSTSATSLQKQRIAFEQGEEAARKFELVQQGMSDAMAERVAEEEAALRLEQSRKQAAESFKQQRIELEKGAEAARIYALEQQGLTAAEAKAQAAEERKLQTGVLVKQEVERLRQRRIEIEQGAEAAKKAALIEQGMDSATATRLAAEEASLEKQAQIKQAMSQGSEPLQARESRLLTRGTESQLSVSKEQLAVLQKMLDTLASQKRERGINLVPAVIS